MPTYVYRCQECNTQFESLRSMKDSDAPISCSHCQSTNTHRCLTTCNMNSNSSSAGFNTTNSGSSCGSCQGGSCASCGH